MVTISYIKIALGLLGIISWMRGRQMIQEAEDAQLAERMRQILQEVDDAEKVRKAVRDKLSTDPSWVPSDDPNRRD